MHLFLTFLTLFLVAVDAETHFEESTGIPSLRPDTCLVGRSSLTESTECNNDIVEGPKLDNTDAPAETPQGCGYRNMNGVGIFSNDMHEGEALFGEFPWVVAVIRRQLFENMVNELYTCSGSLIHPKVVLTAAHSIQAGMSSEYKVRAGEWDPHQLSEEYPHQDRLVSSRISHPHFHTQKLHFDIALLFLERPFDLLPNINTICLAPVGQLADSSTCYVSGWGVEATNRDPPSVLKKIDLNLRAKRQCEKDLRQVMGSHFILHNTFICAGGEADKDACMGDGGAPLMCPIANATNRYYQAGIVSWGLDCGTANVPGVYTNLFVLKTWIDRELTARELPLSYYTAK